MRVRVCSPFYWEGDLHALSDQLYRIIFENNLEYRDNESGGFPDWFKYEDIEFFFEPRHTTRIKDGRNSLISDVFDSRKKQYPLEFDFFWGLDTDIDFLLADIISLLRSGYHIAACPYPVHADNKVSNVAKLDENGSIVYRYEMSEKGWRKVDGIPGGFTIYSREALLEIGFPWFIEPMIEWDNGKYCQETGEDIGLCIQAKNIGIEVYCNFDNPVIHKQRTIKWKREKTMNAQASEQPKQVSFKPQDFMTLERANPAAWIQLNAIRLERENEEKDAIIRNMAERLVAKEAIAPTPVNPETPPVPEGEPAAVVEGDAPA